MDQIRMRKTMFVIVVCVFYSALYCEGRKNNNDIVEWEVVNETNFSSQIRITNHIILFVTVPWCGESRAVMKEVSHLATKRRQKLSDLRLMVVYRNVDKTLANALGATDGTSIFCYYHSLSYRYYGRFRGQNIFSSFNHLVSLQPEELPLKFINSEEDIMTLYESTDKAVLLLEFCGWTSKLMSIKPNSTYDASGSIFRVKDELHDGSLLGPNLSGKINNTLTFNGKKRQKGSENEELVCSIESGPMESQLLNGFTIANQSFRLDSDNMAAGFTESCSVEAYKRFESFFLKLTTFAREFFLPIERQKFGVVTERSLLSSLGVADRGSWLVMLHFSGCPNCSMILKEGVNLEKAFHTRHPLVAELDPVEHFSESALPANKPSIVLFIDNSSESLITRRKSKDALDVFRKFAWENFPHDPITKKNSITGRKSPSQVVQRRKGFSNSGSQLTPGKFKDKMSVMIINKGEKVSLGSGDSVDDIIAYLLRQKKEAKLSLVAEKVGFQLVSNDFEIKLNELLLPRTKSSITDDIPSETENLDLSEVNLEDSNLINEDGTDVTGVTDEHSMNNIHVSQNLEVEELSATQTLNFKKNEAGYQYFTGAYFYSDGGYELLRSLTASSTIPSLVIVDPVNGRHYVFPEEIVLTYKSLRRFVDAFLNGALFSYQRSESNIMMPRERTRAPFINFDFHDVDLIPRVTVISFSELVLGFSEPNSRNFGHAWNKDVLVLFSNNWCGFCQRMELVVHEVFRAFKGYMSTLKTGFGLDGSTFTTDQVVNESADKLPLIFLMDCTLNDCHSLLETMDQRELYPALMLYPAKKKTAIPYLGDMSVTNIITFIADYGSNTCQLRGDMGVGRFTDGNTLQNTSLPLEHEEEKVVKETFDEVLMNSKESCRSVETHKSRSSPSDNLHEVTFKVNVGSILTATNKILNAPPFDNSVVLIVQADEETGFRGLIINKRLKWDSYLEGMMHLPIVYAPLSSGGPLGDHLPLVCLTKRVSTNPYSEVYPGVYFLDNVATAKEVAAFMKGQKANNDFWFFIGHSGWARDQLYAEIAEGSWSVSENPEGLFNWPQT